MQFTFILFYLSCYTLNLWILLIFSTIFLPILFYSHLSLNTIFNFIKLYTNLSTLIFLTIFIFAGLPPVCFFLIKLNFLIYLINYWNIYFLFFIFILFFFNMLYYLQIFKYRKEWNLNTILFLKQFNNSTLNYFNNNLLYINNYYTYNILYIIYCISFFLCLTFFFYTDIFLILNNLVYFN